MAGSLRPDLLRQVWEYPLFDALYGRRSRRFGLGFEMAEGPTPYQSHQSPAPLSEDEEALLVAAGVGFSGSRSGIRAARFRAALTGVPSQARPGAGLAGYSSRTTGASTLSTRRRVPR